jgi:hypothetical protein
MRLLLTLIVIAHVALGADIGALSRHYAQDDQRLATALRYQHENEGTRDKVWGTELGDVLKASRELAGTLDELSVSDGDVYFAFHKTTERQPDGGSLVTEERTYFEPYKIAQKTRRTATFPARANALPIEKRQQIGTVPSGIALLAFDPAF